MITVPEQLKTAEEQLEAATSKMVVLDQNYSRVKRLHDSEKEQIRTLQDFKADLQSQNSALSDNRDIILKDIEKYTKELGILKQSITESHGVLSDINHEVETQTVDHTSREEKITAKESELAAREKSVSSKEYEVTERERELEVKHDKIKRFTDSL